MVHPTSVCPKCGDLIANCAMKRHLNSCKGVIRSEMIKISRKYSDEPGNCRYCNRFCKNTNSLIQHELRCKENPNRRDCDKLSKYSTENFKGQTKDTNETIAKAAKFQHESYSSGILKSRFPRPSDIIHLYQDDINLEIAKWHNFISSIEYTLPNFQISTRSDGYQYTCTIDGKSRNEFSTKYILVHTLILQTILNRNLDEKETVHHIDENKSNNSPYNLIIFKTRGDHARFHLKQSALLIYDEDNHNFSCV